MINLSKHQKPAPASVPPPASIPVWDARAGRISDADLLACVAVLRRGGVVAIPTETVYGLAANAADEDAIKALAACKGRDESKGFAVQSAATADLTPLAATDAPVLLRKLLDRFAPGPLTVVATAAPGLPLPLLGTGGSIALRIPDHPVALALLKAFGGPLAVTSANRSGEAPATTLQAAMAAVPGLAAGIDAGPSQIGKPSTVLDLRFNPPVIVREGAIPSDVIFSVIREIESEQP